MSAQDIESPSRRKIVKRIEDFFSRSAFPIPFLIERLFASLMGRRREHTAALRKSGLRVKQAETNCNAPIGDTDMTERTVSVLIRFAQLSGRDAPL
jgi:hypothetical protein